MTRIVRIAVAFAVCSAFSASLVHAQANRTWVSGVGDDVNPCSRTAPCKTFAGAISKTANGGEISVLDPGGYGAVNITKNITLSGDGTLAGILAAGTTGILINGAGIHVVLRNLSIHGGPLGSNPLHGIRVLNAASVLVDRVTIQNFTQNGIISVVGDVTVRDSTISHAINPLLNLGIGAHATMASSITLENVTFTSNNIAIQADNTSNIRMSNSAFYNNKTAFACNINATEGVGTLSSTGNNRKANNTGGIVPTCAPGAIVVVQ